MVVYYCRTYEKAVSECCWVDSRLKKDLPGQMPRPRQVDAICLSFLQVDAFCLFLKYSSRSGVSRPLLSPKLVTAPAEVRPAAACIVA